MCDATKIDPLGGFTEEEMAAYTAQRYKLYSGTIAVCVIYAVIAFILILLAYFTVWGREFLLNTILPFIVTFIIGTIIIIIILAKLVSDYKPTKIDNRLGYDNDICPDYWKLVVSDPTEYKDENGVYLSSNVNPNLFKYKCVMDPNVIDRNEIKAADDAKSVDDRINYKLVNTDNIIANLNDDKIKTKTGLSSTTLAPKYDDFKKYAAYMSGYEIGPSGALISVAKDPIIGETTTDSSGTAVSTPILPDAFGLDGTKISPIECDKVYPLYLAAMDNTNAQLNPNEPKNRFRSAYSKACGVPWTEAGVL